MRHTSTKGVANARKKGSKKGGSEREAPPRQGRAGEFKNIFVEGKMEGFSGALANVQ